MAPFHHRQKGNRYYQWGGRRRSGKSWSLWVTTLAKLPFSCRSSRWITSVQVNFRLTPFLNSVFAKGTFPEVRSTARPIGQLHTDIDQVWVPTIYENYVADVEVDGRHVELSLWDTSGSEDYDRLRPLSYPDTHVIMVCFAIDVPYSLDNVFEKVPRTTSPNHSSRPRILTGSQWVCEVRHFLPTTPFLLIGLRKDLRSDPRRLEGLREKGEHPVTYEEVKVLGPVGSRA